MFRDTRNSFQGLRDYKILFWSLRWGICMGMGTAWESGGSSMRPCSAQRYAMPVSKHHYAHPALDALAYTGMPCRPSCCPHTCR